MEPATNTPKKRGRPAGAKNKPVVKAKSPEVERPPLRASMREEDPRMTAAKRAAEILGQIDGAAAAGADDFIAPPPPPGWSYEWKRHTIYNQEDPAYQTQLARYGWEPVPVSRHPEMMPVATKSSIIERKGMILMMRPAEVTDRIREMERREAARQVRSKEEQLGTAQDGHFGRDHQQVRPKVSKSYEAMPIPDK